MTENILAYRKQAYALNHKLSYAYNNVFTPLMSPTMMKTMHAYWCNQTVWICNAACRTSVISLAAY